MTELRLNVDGSSKLPLDELLQIWTNRYSLLCSAVSRGANTHLVGKIAEHDPAAGRRFIERLDRVVEMELNPVRRQNVEIFRAPVLAGIARAEIQRLLGDLE